MIAVSVLLTILVLKLKINLTSKVSASNRIHYTQGRLFPNQMGMSHSFLSFFILLQCYRKFIKHFQV